MTQSDTDPPQTARRRWSRELDTQIDGLSLASSGPMLVHGYDPPAGGKWIDDAIPGRLIALDRDDGQRLWQSPCEVGYGRGFGAGVDPGREVILLGPGIDGHRIVRMSISDGELIGAGDIPAFDAVDVASDYCLCVTAGGVTSVDVESMASTWSWSREGERYHLVAREADQAIVVHTDLSTRLQGLLRLDAETGSFEEMLIDANQTHIYDLAITGDIVIFLATNLETLMPPELAAELAMETGQESSDPNGIAIVATRLDGSAGDAPLWYRMLGVDSASETQIGLRADNGKLYVERGAWLGAFDALTGRLLGRWTVPGLDEQVDWRVADGAGLLAEETRVSLFELPA
ncbi:MAG: hypothetical protein ACI841_002476 [Planctomycetota bacterium]|jgi:hypothetical protein